MQVVKKLSLRTIEISILVVIVITAVFFLMRATKDAPSIINNPSLSQEAKTSLIRKFGLDAPLYMQLLEFWKNFFGGSLGVSLSLRQGQEIGDFIWPKFGISLTLAAISTLLATLLGIGLGVLIGLRPHGYFDKFMQVLIAILISVPAFIFGVIFIIAAAGTGFPLIYEQINPVTWILPVFSLAIPISMFVTRFMRTNLIKSLDTQHARLAQAKGISPVNIIFRHLLKDSLFTVITFLPIWFVGVVVSSVLVEVTFAIPGLGRTYSDSISTKDYNVVLVITTFFTILTALAYIVRDFLQQVINPLQRRKGVN